MGWPLMALLLWGCAPIEDPEPPQVDGEEIALPPPGVDWLSVEDVEPQEAISLRPTVAVTFNQYLDSETFNSFGAMRLRSRGITQSGAIKYQIATRTVYFRPGADLEPQLEYLLEWRASDVQSVEGAPLHPMVLLPRYTTDEELDPTPPLERSAVTWEEVEAIFDRSCNQCHGDPNWQLPSLEYDHLVGGRSEQVDRYLVEPLFPTRSYLMHKILADYPDRLYGVQPPPWSDAPPLEEEELILIEDWIATGAPGPEAPPP